MRVIATFVLLCISSVVDCRCYFPIEFQGVFVTQLFPVPASFPIQYSEVIVLPDAIPKWGICHKKFGMHAVLHDRTGGDDCIRCFLIRLRSSNILELFVRNLDTCYSSEREAIINCPLGAHPSGPGVSQILLYKTKTFSQLGETAVLQEYCPITGRYGFSYSINDGIEDEYECKDTSSSHITNCPYGFGLSVHFQRCSFGDMDIAFQCLGDWDAEDGERYLTLLDTQQHDDPRPRYRCARYREDPSTGRIRMALSSDSTCTNGLVSASEGYETLFLKPLPEQPWPQNILASTCSFPDWLVGRWEDMHVTRETVVYRDRATFKSLTAKCLNLFSDPIEDRYLIYTRSDCGDDYYSCIWFQKRSVNVMEYQLALTPSSTMNRSLCDSSNFIHNSWITQGNTKIVGTSQSQKSSCPVFGEYTGFIPDATELCARLTSDCQNPDVMFYTVSSCQNQSEIYEDREYRCLGQWIEGNTMYTYTLRHDVKTYECFVGRIKGNGSEILIKEAGNNCQRDDDSEVKGMKLVREGGCVDFLTINNLTHHIETIKALTTTLPTTTTTTVLPTKKVTLPYKPWFTAQSEIEISRTTPLPDIIERVKTTTGDWMVNTIPDIEDSSCRLGLPFFILVVSLLLSLSAR